MSIVRSFLDESKPVPQEVLERIAAGVKNREIDLTDPDNPPLTEVQLTNALRYARERLEKERAAAQPANADAVEETPAVALQRL